MIGLDGELRDYPKFFFLKLKSIHRNFSAAGMEILVRDRQTGFWRIMPAIYAFREVLETVYYNPARELRSSAFKTSAGRSIVSLWSMIGGLTTPLACQVEPVVAGQDATLLVAELESRRRSHAVGAEGAVLEARLS